MKPAEAVVKEDHALLSASAAHRWLVCTPAPRLEATLPESTSEYAEEGRLAHAIGELKLRKQYVEPMSMRTFNSRLKKLKADPLYKDEMLTHTDTYLDYICSITHAFEHRPYVAVEKKLDYSAFAPEGFGTGDCIILYSDTLFVVDFKYGQGVPVSAENNPQMKLYALGAFLAYSLLYPIKHVKLAIVQPRVGDPSEWEISIEELLAWGESIKPIAEKAFRGEGNFVPGEHCKFCRAKARCRARAESNLSLEEFKLRKPPLISNDEVGHILDRAQNLVSWAKHISDYALAEILKDNEIPGWKAVHGRSNRVYVDIDAAFKTLTENGYDEALLYERKPLTVPNVEKLLGKAKYEDLLVKNELVKLEPGKPTLAALSDKREAITRISAKDDFKKLEE